MSRLLFDFVSTLDNVAQIIAYRGIANSAMSKCIGSIRQDMRERARSERNGEVNMTDLDQRNGYDEDNRAANDVKNAMGFRTDVSPLTQASTYHAVYDWAVSELSTLSQSKWDAPLTVNAMIDFMVKNASNTSGEVIKALADVIGTDEKTLREFRELEAQREREQLEDARSEIVNTFNGFGENGYDECTEDLPIIAQHQLGVKVVEALQRGLDQTTRSILRTQRLADLANITLIKDAIAKATAWVESFEQLHMDEIREVIDSGRNIRTIEDLQRAA